MKIEEKDGKLIVTSFDEFEAYRIASAVERDGLRFYGAIAQQVKDLSVKKTLNLLMEEEKKHLAFFEGCLNYLREKAEDHGEDNDLLSSMDFGVFQPFKSMDNLDSLVADIKKALAIAVLAEEKSVKFYVACREAIFASRTKNALTQIIEEEKKHKKFFEELLKRA
ncbi:MAG: ferritin family protein [Candidatus Omnitrophica bacterium]|nr:ferritin family protein [Candidatus Omnitrophota bacterium]